MRIVRADDGVEVLGRLSRAEFLVNWSLRQKPGACQEVDGFSGLSLRLIANGDEPSVDIYFCPQTFLSENPPPTKTDRVLLYSYGLLLDRTRERATLSMPLSLNSGIILGLMAAPIMTTIAEDALKAVPDHYREAAEAMGATKWQVIFKVVLPAGKNGLMAAVLLGVGRGFGETMAVLMASGHSVNIPTSVFDSVRALTATIAAELGETAVGSEHYRALFTLGIFLFIVTFIINLTADLVVRGVKKG